MVAGVTGVDGQQQEEACAGDGGVQQEEVVVDGAQQEVEASIDVQQESAVSVGVAGGQQFEVVKERDGGAKRDPDCADEDGAQHEEVGFASELGAQQSGF